MGCAVGERNSFVNSRHCEVRSNRELYREALLIGDCFVPRNDVFEN
jgi:hypothetical protein